MLAPTGYSLAHLIRPHRALTALLCVGVLTASGALAQSGPNWDDSAIYREAYPVDGVELGRGWFQNLSTAAARRCISGVKQDLKSSDVSFNFSEVTSREQVYKALRVNAAAKYGAFSASANFADQFSADRNRLNVMASVDVRKFGVYWAPPADGRLEIDKKALDELRKYENGTQIEKMNALRRFFDECGDSYVSAIENGANYTSRFTIVSSAESREKLFGAAASGGFGRFKASMSMSNTTASVLTDNSTQIATVQSGGPLDLPLTAPAAYARIAAFPISITDTNAVPFTIVLRPYESNPGFPDKFQNLRTPPATIGYLAGLAERFDDLSESYRGALFARQAYQFPYQSIDMQGDLCRGKPGMTEDRCLQEELAAAARNTSSISACLGNIVLWCKADSVCDLQRIPSDTIAARCMTTEGLNDQIAASAAADQGGRKKLGPNEIKDLVGTLLSTLVRPKVTGDNTKTLALNTDAISRSYLAYLARAPLTTNKAPKERDIDIVVATCAQFADKGNCTADGLPDVKPDSPVLLAMNAGMREWVFSERLGKAISGACQVGKAHPLCQSSAEAVDVAAELKASFSVSRRFPVSASTPLPPVAAAEVPVSNPVKPPSCGSKYNPCGDRQR